MQKISPCLWFDSQAEEAARFYVSLFKDSKMGAISRYGDEAAKASGQPKGSVLTVTFQLEGQDFMALNGGPIFKFTEAVSFMVDCATQQEIDFLWEKLSAGGSPGQCGWLKDRYGLSWQIVPSALGEMMKGKDPVKTAAVMGEVMRMTKLDIAAMRRAYDGATAKTH